MDTEIAPDLREDEGNHQEQPYGAYYVVDSDEVSDYFDIEAVDDSILSDTERAGDLCVDGLSNYIDVQAAYDVNV